MSTASVVVLVVVASALAFLGGVLFSRRRPTPHAAASVMAPAAPASTETPTPDPVEPTEPEVPEAVEATEDPLLGRLSRAVDEIDHGVIVVDGDGTERFRNRAARRLADARDGLVLVDAAVRELLGAAIEGRTLRREVELYGPPAQSFVVSAHPFVEGVQSGALALVEDRSLQKRTETVRRDFVANISHELKTPIGALGLLAETIRDEPDPEVVARLSERMITEADRASCTVDDLLELSRIEFGDDAEFLELDAQSVVAEATGRIASAADQAGVEVTVEVDPGLRLVGDRRQLVSALFNLLDNAVKYSPQDSEVVVAAAAAEDGSVLLTVSDHGIGIPRRDLDRIFERFYRVDRARSRGTGGTGLGLAIVRHVASNHGGGITVESTEGIGTTFSLTLPPDHDGPVGATPATVRSPGDGLRSPEVGLRSSGDGVRSPADGPSRPSHHPLSSTPATPSTTGEP